MKDFVVELHVSLGDPQSAIMTALAAGLQIKKNGGTIRRYAVREAAGRIIEDVPFPEDDQVVLRRAAELFPPL